MEIHSYKDLIVWQRSIELVKIIYKITEEFPKSEIYSLTSQMRRSAISIPSNIAEGRQRSTRKDFSHFLRVAQGSVAELETQIIIARDLYPNKDYELADLKITEVQKMLSTMMKKLLDKKASS